MTQPASRPASRAWLYGPLIAVLVLAALWSAGWFYAANRADEMISAWLVREASSGRTYECAERRMGGYPFRIEMRCRAPTATLAFADGPVRITAKELVAVAQVYQPDLVIAEVTGPMSVARQTNDAGTEDFVADWTLMQLSARGKPRAPERVSLVVDNAKVDRAGAGSAPIGRAKRLELHLRKSSEQVANGEAFDLAVQANDTVVSGVPQLGDRPINLQALAVLKGPADLSPTPLPQRLRAWQAAGGRLELKNARLQQAESLAVGRGELSLTPAGQLDGTLNLRMVGLDRLVNVLMGEGRVGRSSAGLLAGLTLFGGTELEGRRAIGIPLRFERGRVFLGPLGIAEVPPLY